MTGFLCGPKLYEYSGWFFEVGLSGPWPLKKDGELKKQAGRKFSEMVEQFQALTDKEKSTYRIGGGCQEF